MTTFQKRPLIYVAGPYTLPSPTHNTYAAIDAGDRVLSRGAVPIIPHLSMLWDTLSPKSYEEWMAIDFQLIARCDGVWRLPGESKGADREVEFASEREIRVDTDLDRLLRRLEGVKL